MNTTYSKWRKTSQIKPLSLSWSGGKLFLNLRQRNINTRSSVGQCCYCETLACFPWKLSTNRRTNILTNKECPASSLRPQPMCPSLQRFNTPFGDRNRHIFTPQRTGLWSCAKVGGAVCYGSGLEQNSGAFCSYRHRPHSTACNMTSGVQFRSQPSWTTRTHAHTPN